MRCITRITASLLLVVNLPETLSLLWNIENTKNFYEKMNAVFQERFNDEVQEEATALWLGVSDPLHGDMYWVFGKDTNNNPATIEDHVYIGSISKAFGATVHLLLIEEGYYNLEDTIETLVPDFTKEFPEYATYTVRELLGMQSRNPDFLNHPQGLVKQISEDEDKRYTIPEIVEFALRNSKNTDSDFTGQYSTTNYLVMEYVAENVTGLPMPQLVHELVLEPMELEYTAELERDSDGVLPEPAAIPYAGPACVHELQFVGGNAYSIGQDLTGLSRTIVMTGTGGGMYSTIQDLLEFAKSGTGDSLLSEESIQARHNYQIIKEGINYGLGQYLIRGWYGHSGDAFGFATSAYKNDALGASFAAAANSCNLRELLDSFRDLYKSEVSRR